MFHAYCSKRMPRSQAAAWRAWRWLCSARIDGLCARHCFIHSRTSRYLPTTRNFTPNALHDPHYRRHAKWFWSAVPLSAKSIPGCAGTLSPLAVRRKRRQGDWGDARRVRRGISLLLQSHFTKGGATRRAWWGILPPLLFLHRTPNTDY